MYLIPFSRCSETLRFSERRPVGVPLARLALAAARAGGHGARQDPPVRGRRAQVLLLHGGAHQD